MRRILLVILLISLGGCGRGQPRMAGGKWAEALRASDPKVRKKAAFTLGNIGPGDPAVLPALLAALKDTDSGVRREAILALLKLGPGAGEAVPVVEEMSRRDPDSRVRACATQALGKLRNEPAGSR
jgi:HEAT repeat protein